MALLFVLVTFGSSIVHACEGQHATHVHKLIAPHNDGVVMDGHAHHNPTPPADRDGSGHPCCADLQCHVGSFVMTAVCTAIAPLPKAETLAIPDESGDGTFVVSLDRPPKPLVQF